MKNIEVCKPEDLACQVADANPGNFTIEQEVAQLVGATVPAPTEPSADDARELGAQLLVFLRRALLPIRSALRTAVAAIYAHLDSRCTDYTPAAYDPFRLPAGPYDPMRHFAPRTLPNLLTALTAFSARKISNGSATADGIKDGVSLAHLLCSTDAANAVTEIVDDNTGWDCNNTFNTSSFTNISRIVINAKRQTAGHVLANGSNVEVLEVGFEEVTGGSFLSTDNTGAILFPRLHTVLFNKLKKLTYASGIYERGWINPRENNMPLMSDWHFPVLEEIVNGVYLFCFYGNSIDVKRIYMESIETANNPIQRRGYTIALEYLYIGYTRNKGTGFIQSTSLGGQCFTIELKQGYGMNLNIAGYAPTLDSSNLNQFLQNFKDHIALRLTANGSGKTLTLSQAVRDAIHAAEATYGIEAIIVTQKGWTLSPAPGASSQ